MTKVLSLLLLTLAFCCAFGDQINYVEQNYAKMPVSVANENLTGIVVLKSFGPGDLSLTSTNFVKNTKNISNSLWTFWRRSLNTNDLSVISTKNYTFYGGDRVIFHNGFAVEFFNDRTASGFRIMVKQTNLESNITLPAFPLTDSDHDAIPTIAANFTHEDSIFICVNVADALNITGFKVGGPSVMNTFTAPGTAYDQISMISGGSLTNSQLLVTTSTGPITLAEIFVDFSDGTSKINKRDIPNGSDRYGLLDCKAYTSSKTFGSVCSIRTPQIGGYFYLKYYATSSLSDFSKKFSLVSDPYPRYVHAYGSDFVVIKNQPLITQSTQNVEAISDYQVWNETEKSFNDGSIQFIIEGQYSPPTISPLQIGNGKLYVMAFYFTDNSWCGEASFYSGLRVGILLDNSANTTKSFFDDEDDKVAQSFLA